MTRDFFRRKLIALADRVDARGADLDERLDDAILEDLGETADELAKTLNERDAAVARAERAETALRELAIISAAACVYTPRGSANEGNAMGATQAWLRERKLLDLPQTIVVIRPMGSVPS